MKFPSIDRSSHLETMLQKYNTLRNHLTRQAPQQKNVEIPLWFKMQILNNNS